MIVSVVEEIGIINKLHIADCANKILGCSICELGVDRRHPMGFRPKASEVLTAYLKQVNEPPWTSYFVKQTSVVNDQFGKSHFNWKVGDSNYHILRTGCFPYIKYHCTKREYQDLTLEDSLMGVIKLMNLGIPTLMYGVAATMLITHKELVNLDKDSVWIYFLLKEHTGARY